MVTLVMVHLFLRTQDYHFSKAYEYANIEDPVSVASLMM
jgi:hypothetical protein